MTDHRLIWLDDAMDAISKARITYESNPSVDIEDEAHRLLRSLPLLKEEE